MLLFHIKDFSCHVTLLLKRKLQHEGHKWAISGIFCGSVGQVGQQVQPTFNPDCRQSRVYMPITSAMPKYHSNFPIALYAHLEAPHAG